MEKIIIFGTGQYFKFKREYVSSKYIIEGCIDNKIRRDEIEMSQDGGICIRNPENIDKFSADSKIFLMSVYFVSMWQQLIKLNVAPQRIVFPFDMDPFYEHENVIRSRVKHIVFSKDYFECKEAGGDIVRICDDAEWREYLRRIFTDYYPLIGHVQSMDIKPVSLYFGTERGTPVDRYYIDKFLGKNSKYIQGDVLEIEDNKYTKQYGGNNVRRSIVMDVNSKAEMVDFNANLETGEGIRDGIADCFILTQTLMYIFDIRKAAENVSRLLKNGGTALITCSGLSQNSRRCMDNYGSYFNFNMQVFEKMFEGVRGMRLTDVGSYGNVKTVTAHLAGMCIEDLQTEDFEVNDKYYPLIVYAVVKKEIS